MSIMLCDKENTDKSTIHSEGMDVVGEFILSEIQIDNEKIDIYGIYYKVKIDK